MAHVGFAGADALASAVEATSDALQPAVRHALRQQHGQQPPHELQQQVLMDWQRQSTWACAMWLKRTHDTSFFFATGAHPASTRSKPGAQENARQFACKGA